MSAEAPKSTASRTAGNDDRSLPLLNYVPVLLIVTGGAMAVWLHAGWGGTVLFAIAWLYLIPPFLCRILLLCWGSLDGVHTLREPAFRRWWLLTQLQALYSRFPALEEVLRVVPGLYNAWLRLWGARVSLFVFWSPGAVVMDRQWLTIGARAVIAPGARLGAHVMQTTRDGEQRLTLAPLRIDEGAMIGLQAGVGPGCHVHGNETVPPRKFLRPFTVWRDGRAHPAPRVDGAPAPSPEAP